MVNGAASTLVAALCLAGSESYVFSVFFYTLLTVVLCGAFQGLLVLPVLLSLCNRRAVAISPDSSTALEATMPEEDFLAMRRGAIGMRRLTLDAKLGSMRRSSREMDTAPMHRRTCE